MKVKVEPMNTRGRSRLNKSGGEAHASLSSKPGQVVTEEYGALALSADKESKIQNIYKKPYPLSDTRLGSGTRIRRQNPATRHAANNASNCGGEPGDR